MKRLLITGGAGFIGTNFVYYWLKNHPDHRVIVLDALTYAGNRQNLINADKYLNFTFVHGNILDRELVEDLLKKYKIDTIIHFAAESHVDRSIHQPDEFINTNVLGTHTLLKAAKSVWLNANQPSPKHRFHHVSTDEVYGTLAPKDPPFSEITPYAPNSPYAASKAASDHLVRAYHETFDLQVTTSNCSNNYGPYQFPEKLIPLVINNVLKGKSLPIYGDGNQIRDWLYVDDHNRGIELILKNGTVGETYNIGGCNEWKNIDIVILICKLIDEAYQANPTISLDYPKIPQAKGNSAESLITFVTDRLGHDRRYAIDAAKISSELRFKPIETFETGIKKTLQWYLDNRVWCTSVMDGSYQQWIKANY